MLVDEEYDFGPMTMTSTPKKKKPRKHALTPESKQRNEPTISDIIIGLIAQNIQLTPFPPFNVAHVVRNFSSNGYGLV